MPVVDTDHDKDDHQKEEELLLAGAQAAPFLSYR
jgi:hypothetical protein